MSKRFHKKILARVYIWQNLTMKHGQIHQKLYSCRCAFHSTEQITQERKTHTYIHVSNDNYNSGSVNDDGQMKMIHNTNTPHAYTYTLSQYLMRTFVLYFLSSNIFFFVIRYFCTYVRSMYPWVPLTHSIIFRLIEKCELNKKKKNEWEKNINNNTLLRHETSKMIRRRRKKKSTRRDGTTAL